MNNFINLVAEWVIVVVVSIMRLAGLLDTGLGYLLGLVGVGPAREVYILLGISLALATVVFRGLGGIIGWLLVMMFFLMLIDLQLPQMNAPGWMASHVLAAF